MRGWSRQTAWRGQCNRVAGLWVSGPGALTACGLQAVDFQVKARLHFHGVAETVQRIMHRTEVTVLIRLARVCCGSLPASWPHLWRGPAAAWGCLVGVHAVAYAGHATRLLHGALLSLGAPLMPGLQAHQGTGGQGASRDKRASRPANIKLWQPACTCGEPGGKSRLALGPPSVRQSLKGGPPPPHDMRRAPAAALQQHSQHREVLRSRQGAHLNSAVKGRPAAASRTSDVAVARRMSGLLLPGVQLLAGGVAALCSLCCLVCTLPHMGLLLAGKGVLLLQEHTQVAQPAPARHCCDAASVRQDWRLPWWLARLQATGIWVQTCQRALATGECSHACSRIQGAERLQPGGPAADAWK